MSKKGDRKLGRNPFEKAPRRGKRQPDPPAAAASVEPPNQMDLAVRSQEVGAPADLNAGVVNPSSPAWLLVDLWAGAVLEPYFFWLSSWEFCLKAGQVWRPFRP